GVPDRPRQVPDVTYKKKGTHTAGGVPDRPRQVPDVTYKKKGTHTAGDAPSTLMPPDLQIQLSLLPL
ncbi:hypothetical protein NDU88_005013, partial [Pleurodeles waltl]